MVSAPPRACPPDRGADPLGVHRGLDGPVLEGPLGDAVDPLARSEGRRAAREEVVGVRHLEARDLEDVLEAPGREEGELRSPALDHRVHPDGGAVREVADRVRLPSMPARELRDAVHHLGAGGLGRREGLVGEHRSRHLVEDAEVGERPANVDADAKAGVRLIHIRLTRLQSHKVKEPTRLSAQPCSSFSARSYRVRRRSARRGRRRRCARSGAGRTGSRPEPGGRGWPAPRQGWSLPSFGR